MLEEIFHGFTAFPNSVVVLKSFLLVAEEISTPRKDQGRKRRVTG